MSGYVLVADVAKLRKRKSLVRGLGLLQAQHVRCRRLTPLHHVLETRVDAVDVPCGYAHLLRRSERRRLQVEPKDLEFLFCCGIDSHALARTNPLGVSY